MNTCRTSPRVVVAVSWNVTAIVEFVGEVDPEPEPVPVAPVWIAIAEREPIVAVNVPLDETVKLGSNLNISEAPTMVENPRRARAVSRRGPPTDNIAVGSRWKGGGKCCGPGGVHVVDSDETYAALISKWLIMQDSTLELRL